MRKGGLLDRFPLHLFTSTNGEGATLILDSPELGRLQLQPVPEGDRTVIVLSLDREDLEETRKAVGSHGGQEAHLIQANPERLPFRDQSLKTILTLSDRAVKPERSTGADRRSDVSGEELDRVLSPTGSIVELARMPHGKAIRNQRQPEHFLESGAYYARPASGDSYFVTRTWIPTPGPFESLDRGRIRSMRFRADLFFSRLAIHPLCDSVGLFVRWKSGGEPLIEYWNIVENREGYEGVTRLTSQSDFGLFVKAGWKAFLVGGAKSGGIVKFPLSVAELSNMKNHIKNLNALNGSGNPMLSAVLPKVIDQGYLCGQSFWAETRLESGSTKKFRWQPGWRERTGEAALSFIVDLHRSTGQLTQIRRGQFDELLKPHVTTLEAEAKKSDPGFELGPLVEVLWRVFDGRHIPLVRTHGDFWSGNLLNSAEGRLTGVLDWDASVEQGWPMLDLLNYVSLQRKWRTIWHFGSVVTRDLMRRRLTRWEREMFAKYCIELEIDDELWPSFVALYWLNRTSRYLGDYDESWLKQNVIKPLPKILGAVSSMHRPVP